MATTATVWMMTSETERQRLSTECLGLTALPARLDDEMMRALETVYHAPCPPPEPCDDRHLGQCLRMMLAVLPRRNADDLSGELFVAAYQRMLGGKAKDQISYMTDAAMARCKWFPTIAECIEICDDWYRDDPAKREWSKRRSAAYEMLQAEKEARSHDNRHADLIPEITQADVDAMDETLIRIGIGSGALERGADGIVRPVKW